MRVASVNGRIVLVSAEDARVVRAALCAGRTAGLLPRAGVVWLLPATLPPTWLTVAPSDTHNCTDEELHEVADAHLSVAPAWFVEWDPARSELHRNWTTSWRKQCSRYSATAAECGTPGPHAAVLYDALRLWHAALSRLLKDDPAAVDDIHCNTTVR